MFFNLDSFVFACSFITANNRIWGNEHIERECRNNVEHIYVFFVVIFSALSYGADYQAQVLTKQVKQPRIIKSAENNNEMLISANNVLFFLNGIILWLTNKNQFIVSIYCIYCVLMQRNSLKHMPEIYCMSMQMSALGKHILCIQSHCTNCYYDGKRC